MLSYALLCSPAILFPTNLPLCAPPLSLSAPSPSYVDPLGPAFLSSALLSGLEDTPDFNDPLRGPGAGYFHFNIRGEAVRHSVAISGWVRLDS